MSYIKHTIFITSVLLPIALLSGYFLANLFSSIISLLFLIYSINFGLKKYYFNIYFFIFILFCLILILSSLLADKESITHSLKTSLLYFRHGLLALAIWFCCENFKYFHKYFLCSAIIAAVFVCISGYYEFFSGELLIGNKESVYRLTLITNGKMIVGSFLAKFSPIIFAMIIFIYHQNGKVNKIHFFYSILLIAMIVLVFLSGERTQVLIVMIPVLVFIFLYDSLKLLRLSLPLLLISLFILTINFYPNIKERVIDHTISQIGINSDKIYPFSILHSQYYQNSLNMFVNNPILGVGTNTFRIECKNKNYFTSENLPVCSTHPHNFYIQLLAENGLIGFSFLILIYLVILTKMFRHMVTVILNENRLFNNYQLILLSYYLAILWPVMPTNNFFNSYMSIFIFFPLGFLLASFSKK